MLSRILLAQRSGVAMLDEQRQSDRNPQCQRADDQEVTKASPPGAHSGDGFRQLPPTVFFGAGTGHRPDLLGRLSARPSLLESRLHPCQERFAPLLCGSIVIRRRIHDDSCSCQ
jgi:hypothetical protein